MRGQGLGQVHRLLWSVCARARLQRLLDAHTASGERRGAVQLFYRGCELRPCISQLAIALLQRRPRLLEIEEDACVGLRVGPVAPARLLVLGDRGLCLRHPRLLDGGVANVPGMMQRLGALAELATLRLAELLLLQVERLPAACYLAGALDELLGGCAGRAPR